MKRLIGDTQGPAAGVEPAGIGDGEVPSWMALQIAIHRRRARTRRELFRVSGRDLDRMGLTRFEIETGRPM
ncbi:MAG: hypothetical protein O3C65_03405 [Proteobacteria bacterium]|nr:hypothetical protein [Pseudomonadota bacterium]MDA1057710.1 hypothetical protein [Pseudomonadota bacterium]